MARIIGTERGAGVQSDDSSAGGSSGMRPGSRPGGRKPSFKTRGSGGPHAQHGRNIRATKVTLPVSKVQELASKFNAVVVDRESEGRALLTSQRAAVKTRISSSTPSSVVSAKIQRFEGIIVDHKGPRSAERPKRVLVRTNSCLKEQKLKDIPEAVAGGKFKKAGSEVKLPKDRVIERSENAITPQRSGENSNSENNQRTSDSVDAQDKRSEAKPKIKPKPTDISSNYRGSLSNLTKVTYKESYSKNNNRLSLPRVGILGDLDGTARTGSDNKRNKSTGPNSSFLWRGNAEKLENVDQSNVPGPAEEEQDHQNELNGQPTDVPSPSVASSVEATVNGFEENPKTGNTSNVIANQSSLYRQLGRSQENLGSLKRNQENIKAMGRSQESVASEEQHQPLVRHNGSQRSRESLNTEEIPRQAPGVHKEQSLVNRVSFHLPPIQSSNKGKDNAASDKKKTKLSRASSIRSNASYEDIGPYKYEDLAENSYAVIADYNDSEAIYDDVLNVVPQIANEGIYESIYSGEGPKDDSDSSLDHPNSLYDHRPASQASSGSGGRRSAATKSDTSDEWVDIDLEDKDRKEEFILLEDKRKPKPLHDSWSQRVRRQWSNRIAEEFKTSRVAISSASQVYLLGADSDVKRATLSELEPPKSTKGLVSLRDVIFFGEEYEAQEVSVHLRNEGESNEEIYESTIYDESAVLDDFDDSSDSEGESGGKTGGFDLHRPSSPPQSQNGGVSGRESEGIYGLMMSAGKKVKKTSWSISQRLRRRMSKISSSVSNGGESINGDPTGQKRWPSFKKKSKSSTSKFYLDSSPASAPEPLSLPTNGLSRVPQPLSTTSLPLVLPPFKEPKRPSIESLPTAPQPTDPVQPQQHPIPVPPASLPLVLPPFKDSRRPSPPPGQVVKSSPPLPTKDSRRLSTALPTAPRPTSPPPPPPPPMNGETKSSSKCVNDPTLYVESGLFGYPQAQPVILNQTNQPPNDSNSNHSGSSGKSNSQWYSDVGLYENATSENDKRRVDRDDTDESVRRVSNSSWFSDLGLAISPPNETDSGQGSQLDLQFADEPLYQFYAARVAELEQSENNSDIGYEEIGPNSDRSAQEIYSPSDVSVGSTGSGGLRPSALDLVSPESLHRTLWCQVPQVMNSGILESLTTNQKRLQEAKFELITSEASYYKSLTVLERTFANSPLFRDETVIPRVDYKTLFSNIVPVRKCSEALLAGLENCWQESILLDGVCDVLLNVAKEYFSAYIRYCSHQIAIERTLKRLKRNTTFSEKLTVLESSPACHSLSLSSFLLLPMQRVTRLPLLLDAIMTKLESGSSEFDSCQAALLSLNKVVHDCNEAARQTERLEEMVVLNRALVFPKHLRPIPLMSASRWLVRSGQVLQYNPDTKLTFSKKLTAPRQLKLTIFLFSDLFFITKKKGEDSFSVITYCPRNFVQMSQIDDPLTVPGMLPTRFLIAITILENHEGKTQELIVCCNSESCRQRWLQPFSRPTSEDPDQVLYETWDCPQVVASHAYSTSQPDELPLQPSDVVNVLMKMADGWFYGERLRDSEKGWFPGNYVTEVASAHVRARNLRQRHRLLALSSTLIQQRQLQS